MARRISTRSENITPVERPTGFPDALLVSRSSIGAVPHLLKARWRTFGPHRRVVRSNALDSGNIGHSDAGICSGVCNSANTGVLNTSRQALRPLRRCAHRFGY